MDSAAAEPDLPPCTLDPTAEAGTSTCYCTNRPGCPFDGGDDYCAHCDDPACTGDCDDDLQCPCGGSCWDDAEPERPIETATIRGGLL